MLQIKGMHLFRSHVMSLQVKLQLLADTLMAASTPGKCPASFERLM
jgi:hypothetical protein